MSTYDQNVIERDAALAARWRELEIEALDVARTITDSQAKQYMLIISEAYRILAERAELPRGRLTDLARRRPPMDL